jgi:hypothetical protein
MFKIDQNSGMAKSKRSLGIGEYCRGKDIDECRGMFGEGLEAVCATCPS